MHDPDRLNELEMRGRWDEAIAALKAHLGHNPGDLDSRVRLIFLSWYVLLEGDHIARRDPAELEVDLHEAFNHAMKLYADVPAFLFFTGYIASISPWYFESSDFPGAEEQAKRMVRKARDMDPDNDLYGWGYHMVVSGDSESARVAGIALSRAIKHGQAGILKDRGLMGSYFREMIEASCRQSSSQ